MAGCNALTSSVTLFVFGIVIFGDAPQPDLKGMRPELILKMTSGEFPRCLALVPEKSELLLGTTAGVLYSIDLTSKKTRTLELSSGALLQGALTSIAVSDDGKTALVGAADGKIRQIDLSSFALTRSFDAHRGPVRCITYQGNNRYAMSGSSGDKAVVKWDLTEGKVCFAVQATDSVDAIVMANDQKSFITTAFLSMQRWNAASGGKMDIVSKHTSRVHSAFMSPDGKCLISCGSDAIVLSNVVTGKATHIIDKRTISESFALSKDGRHLLKGGIRMMQLFDLCSGKEVGRWENRSGPVRVAFGPKDASAISAEDEGVFFWPSLVQSVSKMPN
jgi:WD40 repeat protein